MIKYISDCQLPPSYPISIIFYANRDANTATIHQPKVREKLLQRDLLLLCHTYGPRLGRMQELSDQYPSKESTRLYK